MPRLTQVPLTHRQALNELTVQLSHAPKSMTHPPRAYLRALRAALRMSQAQLSERSGVPQAHIARIESGRIDAQIGTLRRLFDAMFCDLLVIPRPRRRPGDALADRMLVKPEGPPWAEPHKYLELPSTKG